MLLFFLGRQSHITMCFILFIYFYLALIWAFLVFHTCHLCKRASMSKLVCVNAWAAFLSLCAHYMFFYGHEGSSPDVVCPRCSRWLHSYSIINRFREDHIYSRNSPYMLLFSLLFFLGGGFVILLSSVETLSLSVLTWWLFKTPLLLKKGKGEREKEGGKKRGKEGMRNHPSARRSPLSGHVFPLGTQGWRGCYASNRTLMAEALKKSR